MSFAIRNLSVLAYANGFTLWHYKSKDDIAGISAPGYFADASDMLTVGDIVIVTSAGAAKVVVVSDASDGAVSTASLL